MQGYAGLQGPMGPVKTIDTTNSKTTIVPFIPIGATIRPGAIYLNFQSSYYTMNISVDLLGQAYQPQVIGPGIWTVNSIFAGSPPPSGTVPSTYFNMSQKPVTFFVQNVGGVPIQLVFGSNDSDTSIVYLSFGTSPNQTPSSYLLQPLSILIIQAVFTSNNAVRFYNSFLDAINYNQLYRILDRAVKNNYFLPPRFKNSDTLATGTLYTDTTFDLVTTANKLAQNQYVIGAPITITLNGKGLAPGSVNLFIFIVNQTSTLVLEDLVGIRNYKGVSVPSTLNAGSTVLVVVDDRTVTAYDPTTTLGYGNTNVNQQNGAYAGVITSILTEKEQSSK